MQIEFDYNRLIGYRDNLTCPILLVMLSLAATAASSEGNPRIEWHGPSQLRMFGNHEIEFTGFVVSGSTEFASGTSPARSLPFSRQGYNVYDYRRDKEGVSEPVLELHEQFWVGIFAISNPNSETADIRFFPYLPITSFDPNTHTIAIDGRYGSLIPDHFKGGRVLLPHEGGLYSGKSLSITGNSAITITIETEYDIDLQEGDTVLIAPQRGEGFPYDFRYLTTLKMDLTNTRYEWRNFQINGNYVHSYHGGAHGDLWSIDWAELDFNGLIAPLATGVIGTLNASKEVMIGPPDAGCVLAHDASDHPMASVGINRPSFQDGVSSTIVIGLNREKQSAWYRAVRGTRCRFTIQGWVE